jgi:hypothetical protein
MKAVFVFRYVIASHSPNVKRKAPSNHHDAFQPSRTATSKNLNHRQFAKQASNDTSYILHLAADIAVAFMSVVLCCHAYPLKLWWPSRSLYLIAAEN